MDIASYQVVDFLTALQISRGQLGILRNTLIRRGARSAKPFLVLSDRLFRIHESEMVRSFLGCVSLGLLVTRPSEAPFEFAIVILWDQTGWYIQTEVNVEDEMGLKVLREFPEREATTLDNCLMQFEAAITDLLTCDDLLDQK